MGTEYKKEGLRERLQTSFFEPETRTGRAFEITIIFLIIISVLVVILESIRAIELQYSGILLWLEIFFTVIFSLELILRLICAKRAGSYIFSFYGIIDIISILPMYVSYAVTGTHIMGPHPFLIIRVFRLIRLFRILKLSKYVNEGSTIVKALAASKRKIIVLLFAVLSVIIMMGALMYLVEGQGNGFTNIPLSIYWAVETMTTVGFGDIVPVTPLGQAIASVLMLLSYVVIAIFVGILSSELTKINYDSEKGRECKSCKTRTSDADAKFCKGCGKKL
jgi:voltage-gated potassium channel